MNKLKEGKYDKTIALVRQATQARHLMTLILDGQHGSGFAVHVGGMTREERVLATKQMVVALTQIAKALVNGLETASPQRPVTPELASQALIGAEPFELQASPPRCQHCGGNLPNTKDG